MGDRSSTYGDTMNFEQVSFVNGINTLKGGKHVDYIVNQITKKVSEIIEKKKKIKVKQNFIKENLMVLLNVLLIIQVLVKQKNILQQIKINLDVNVNYQKNLLKLFVNQVL